MLRLPPGLLACGPGQGRSAFTVYQRRQHPPSLQKEFNHLHYLLGTFYHQATGESFTQTHLNSDPYWPRNRLSCLPYNTLQTSNTQGSNSVHIPPRIGCRIASPLRADEHRRHFTLARIFLIHPSTLYLIKFSVDRLEPESGNCRGALHHDQHNAISLGSRTRMLGTSVAPGCLPHWRMGVGGKYAKRAAPNKPRRELPRVLPGPVRGGPLADAARTTRRSGAAAGSSGTAWTGSDRVAATHHIICHNDFTHRGCWKNLIDEKRPPTCAVYFSVSIYSA